MTVVGMLVLGLIAGVLARFVVPGRDRIGILATIVLGVVGSFVGGWLAHALFHDDSVGILGSTAGAAVVLLAWRAVKRSRRRGLRGMGRRVLS